MWSQRETTMFGKILLSKTLVLSQFNYLLACLPSPNKQRLTDIDNNIINFVRSNRSAQKISKNILQLEKNRGGLELTLMDFQAKGLKIAWVKRLTDANDSGWKDIVKKSLPLTGNDFWKCNTNMKDVTSIFSYSKNIPYFWKNVIINWCEYNFKEPNTLSEICDQPLWFNSFIKDKDKNLIFYKSWYEVGIFKLSDLILNNQLASHYEILRKYPNLNVNFLKYYGFLAMIPRKWKIILQNNQNERPTLISTKLDFIHREKKICSTIVKQCRNEMKDFPTIAHNKWNSNLTLNLIRNPRRFFRNF